MTGLQEAQLDNLQRIARLRPEGELGQAIKDTTLGAHRFAVQITHVWPVLGGGLRAAHRAEVKGLRGRVFIDPSAVNPRGGKPSIYGFYENRRGGDHAFYDRTEEEFIPRTEDAIIKVISK